MLLPNCFNASDATTDEWWLADSSTPKGHYFLFWLRAKQ